MTLCVGIAYVAFAIYLLNHHGPLSPCLMYGRGAIVAMPPEWCQPHAGGQGAGGLSRDRHPDPGGGAGAAATISRVFFRF